MHPTYPKVFSPIRLGPIEIPTRFYFAPHGSALSAGLKPSDDLVAYSTERVKGGGCGLVVVSMVQHERGRTRQPSPHPGENVAALRVFADSIHAAGGKIFAQLLYWWGAFGQWQPFSPSAPSLAPSIRQYGHNDRSVSTHAMGQDEIQAMLRALRQSTANLHQAGFDGVLLHGTHGALIQQFLSPYFNQRQDEYGGSLENRMRFLVESLQAARQGGGSDFAVGVRLNCDELLRGGYGAETARAVIASICQRSLVDYVNLDVGIEPQQFYLGMPNGFMDRQPYLPYVRSVRSAAGDVPVLSVLGRITSMADAEAAIAAGVVDMAGAARQLIAEPEFVRNARNGREERNRTCIACNWCTASLAEGIMGCTINPASYRERLWGVDSFTAAAQSAKVIVVGGGPGGLEAARVAAIRGHRVVLFEARHRLGGALALWAALPGREHYGSPIAWWTAELARLQVEVRLNTRADAAAVLAEKPDAVIVATGSHYSAGGRSINFDADIPGVRQGHVFRPEDLLIAGKRPTGRVIVLDGEGLHTSAGIAEMLAGDGAQVSYVSAGFSPLSPRLIDAFESAHILRRLKDAGVTFLPSTWLKSIGATNVVLYDTHTGRERVAPVDAVVLVTGREPDDAVHRALADKVGQLFCIGDALAARPLAAATYEGQKFARLIGEPMAPANICEAFFGPDDPATLFMPADALRGA